MDRNVRAGKEFALLVWIAVHGVVDEICSNAAVVQECIALAGSTVSGHALTLAPRPYKKIQKRPLGLLYLFAKGRVSFHAINPKGKFTLAKISHALADGL